MKKIVFLFSILFFIGTLVVHSQTRVVTGTVTSAEDDMPIPGVSISVAGTTLGTVTNIDGEFQLEVPDNVQTLVVSFVGMKSQDVQITGAPLEIEMEAENIGIDEVVVTALGIKRSEKALGYAATNVSGDEIMKTRTTDVMGAIAGKVAGVDVSLGSSSPGASNAVIIRGMSSLGGSNQPLYVVDGIPIINNATIASDGLNSSFDFGAGNQMVNPDDVESVTILKGAAASALYGNRASNGVVLITTKEGQKGEDLNVVINSTIEMSDILRLPTYQNEFGMGWDGHHTLIENGSWGPKFDGSMQLWGTVYNNSQKLKPFVALPDNVRDFYDYGFKYQNSASVSGGSETTTFYLSFSQVSEDGIVPTDADQFKKYTGSFTGTHEYGDLKVTSSVKISRQNNEFVATGQGNTVINNISQIPRDISIISLADYKTDPFDTPDYYFTPYSVINPYYALDNDLTTFQSQKVIGKMQFDYQIMEGLLATYRFGIDATDDEFKIGYPHIIIEPGTPNDGEVSQLGEVTKNMTRRREMNHDFFLNYSKEMGNFNLNVLGGMNIFDTKFSGLTAGIENLDIPDFYDLSNSSEAPVVAEDFFHKRMFGIYGNIELAYNEFLFLTLTGRHDQTSTLPLDNNDYFYPGVQLSFAFSNLLSEELQEIISFGKARFAWGQTGKDAPIYSLDPVMIPGVIANPFGDITFPLSGQNAYEVGNRLANLSLQPEIREEIEAGLQMNFFNNRFGFDFTWYNSESTNQIFALSLDPSSGYSSQTTNLGKIVNKGIEVLFNVTPIKTRGFQWDVSLNYTQNDEELLELPEELGDKVNLGGTSQLGYVAVEGGPLGVFEVTVPERLEAATSGFDVEGNAMEFPAGTVIVDDDGNPVAASEKAIIGQAAFDYRMGITNSFAYKGLTFSFDFDIRQGGLIYSRTKDLNLFTGNLVETTYNDRRPFVIPNSVTKTTDENGNDVYTENTVPINNSTIVNYWADGADQLNEAYLLPRSFVKLKRMVLGYDLPRDWIKDTPFEGLNISVYGNNLFLWTPAENHHIDPEATTFGNDLESKYGEFSVNPPTRRFGVNLKLTF